MATVARSGHQFAIAHGGQQAVVTSVGATLRRYLHGGEEVLAGFPEDEIAPDGRGQVLAPWPNRLGDGRYRFGGVDAVVPLNEPERQNAIHGLVRWSSFEPVAHEPARVALRHTVLPQPAYPFAIVLELDYSLDDAGLRVEFRVENLGEAPAPFGIGFHPYLACGEGGVDTARLEVAARERLVFDERALPVGRRALAGSPLERVVAGLEPLGDLVLDDCLTGLDRRGGEVRARLTRGDGRAVELFAEEPFGYLMCFTGDTLAADRRRRSLALEPMTCPPDALRSGTDLLRLASGASVGGAWGIRPLS